MLKLHRTLEATFPESFVQIGKYESKALDDHIHVDDTWVTFVFQEGAKNEHSTPGVLVEDVIKFSQGYIQNMNSSIHSPYNDKALAYLQQALDALDERTADRIKRNVEGTSND